MPVAHYTQHAYGTWMPDRPQGYVHHAHGLKPTNAKLADAYRRNQREESAWFGPDQQRLIIEATLASQEFQQTTVYSVATDRSHLHVAIGWRNEREEDAICIALKQSLTRALNGAFCRRSWFTKGYNCRLVGDAEHLLRLVESYHPSHRGWGWNRREGFRPPIEGEVDGVED